MSLGKDKDLRAISIARAKANIFRRIKNSISFPASFPGTKTDGYSRSPNAGPGKHKPLTNGGKVVTFLNAGLHGPFTTSTDSKPLPSSCSRNIGTRSAHPGKAATISNAISDHSFDAKPTSSSSHNFDDSYPTQRIDIPPAGIDIASTKPHTSPKSPFSSEDSQTPTYHWYDNSTLAEAIDTGQIETSQTTIFDTMWHFPFQDAKAKWQPCYGSDRINRYRVINISLAECSQAPRSMFANPHADLKGKKPVYHGFIENSDSILSIGQSGSPSAHSNSNSSLTASKCTCTPTDAKFALELYLQSTKKQHEQFGHSLRGVGGMTYFLNASNQDGDLVQKLAELRVKVEELDQLIMAEQIVSSVTLTEIHRLMDKALSPTSEHVSALYGEIRAWSVADDGRWRMRRRRATKQKLKEDWEPRMRALSARVDQAGAWAQLVGIRITRASWDW